MSIVLSQKSGKTLVFIREIMEKSGNFFSENGSDPWPANSLISDVKILVSTLICFDKNVPFYRSAEQFVLHGNIQWE